MCTLESLLDSHSEGMRGRPILHNAHFLLGLLWSSRTFLKAAYNPSLEVPSSFVEVSDSQCGPKSHFS